MVGHTIVVGVWQDHQASWPIELVGKSKEDLHFLPSLISCLRKPKTVVSCGQHNPEDK